MTALESRRVSLTLPDHVLDQACQGGLLPTPERAVGAVALIDGRLRIATETVLRSGRAHPVFIWVGDGQVDLAYAPKQLEVLERPMLRTWLLRPLGPLMPGDLAGFVVHHNTSGPTVAVKISAAGKWPMAPRVLALRERV
jgi:hypothetical protein